MSNSKPPKAPGMLESAGLAVWESMVSKYELRVDELILLEDYCSMADEIVNLRAAHVGMDRPQMTKGSMGQLVTHPIPARITDLQMKRTRLKAQLNLPDDPAGEKPNQQRDAANSRWAQAHGKGA